MTPDAPMPTWTTVEELFDQELHARPSAQILAAIRPIERERDEAREFVARAVRLMAIAQLEPRHLTPSVGWMLGSMAPALLPGAWGNVVPPFTLEDRHIDIDRYLREQPWARLPSSATMLEMGCGFPPQTAVDVAHRFPAWQIVGADPRFDPYVLHDAQGNYACMDAEGQVRYFHPANPGMATYMALYKNPSDTFAAFRTLFEQLVPLLPADDAGERVAVEHAGARLVRDAIQGFATPNLRFVQAGIGAEMEPVEIMRIFNVLMYFDADFRRDAERWALNTLKPGGLLLCGGNAAMTTEARYTVYQREHDALVPREFAFSLDNFRPGSMNPWFCLHGDERETFLLAHVTGILRRDVEFSETYDARLDALMAEQRLWVRDTNGALVAPPDQRPASEWLAARLAVAMQLHAEGMVTRAVRALERAGLHAWENVVGHIAMDPTSL